MERACLERVSGRVRHSSRRVRAWTFVEDNFVSIGSGYIGDERESGSDKEALKQHLAASPTERLAHSPGTSLEIARDVGMSTLVALRVEPRVQ